MANRKDVAKLAGVSEATVSRVFNNIGPLREETKQKVLQAAQHLNYHPNAIAQSFARGKSNNIGVIVPYFQRVNLMTTHYFSELLSGIGAKLGEFGYGLLLLFQSPDEPKDYVKLFHTQKVDGCIILGSKDVPGEVEALENLHHLQLPYCLVNQTFSGYPFHSIDAEHFDGSLQAVSSLLMNGNEQIIFLNGPNEFSNSIERLHGYKTALLNVSIPYNPQLLFQGNYSRKSGFQAAAGIASLLPEIHAIFAGNDRMAIGLMQGLGEQGYQAGRDYALIGYDNSEISRMTSPPLSTVHVPLFDMGQLAAEKVLQLITQGTMSEINERLPVTFIERASSQLKTTYTKQS
ncbi:LacI family DNA-binding transcriptional regulator [Bacillus sp. ISL-40]|uniref:LacI family DNA-binding transcriptional regulator n=1 Tax=unclassified Bacillus (in: firmicutes) TaxID=185979 RepID=UPI001BE7E407|nr:MULTISPECIES: LacI family DNA-binding transcriptional regulator [unclassified Bacillus (in: firmicutes)]MBT2698764.1 LacI family DNA-binding transcriptional regulator [Bacillus sp. ISL-40]MBT2720790.1 LacI family DNA-binding transcriptional regulator [Bacillus sp. ISL-46]MBT2740930.1 LacI family DNA-binding transcriptional regulator [Bacillus sp. ISL-77]